MDKFIECNVKSFYMMIESDFPGALNNFKSKDRKKRERERVYFEIFASQTPEHIVEQSLI